MKKIIMILLIPAIAAVALSGCIKETFPEGSTITIDQKPGSLHGMLSDVLALRTFLRSNDIFGYGGNPAWDFGYPSLWLERESMGQDLMWQNNNYNHWRQFYEVISMGAGYLANQHPWTWYYKENYQANEIIGAIISVEGELSDDERHYFGIAYFFKALVYFDLVRMYQPGTYSGAEDTRLTVPFVEYDMTVQQKANNPRKPANEAYAKILEYLDIAAENLVDYIPEDETYPNLNVVDGMRARVYLTMGEWELARQYAVSAMAGYTAMSGDQYCDKVTGFNTPNNAWMFGMTFTAQDAAVQNFFGLVNFTSWMSSEQEWGYASGETSLFPRIDAWLYHQMSPTDARKKLFKNPDTGEIFSDHSEITTRPAYASVKFRPKTGTGGSGDPQIGAAVSLPLMRVEEMMLIEAEAEGRLNLANGVAKLNTFVQTYRDPNYVCAAERETDFINEIFIQRRLELWGEGFSFFDFKRLNKPVIRGYKLSNGKSTNHYRAYNTTEAPYWLTWAIIETETMNNAGIGLANTNPDPQTPDAVPESGWETLNAPY